jgi:hypothetical protein
VGGKAQRPIGLFSGQDQFSRAVPVLGANLHSYILGTIGQLARHIQSGFFRAEGVTPAEQYNHRIAAVQMLGMQVLAAGALGLPGVQGAVSLLNKLFPNLEIDKNFHLLFEKFFGQDHENGSPWADAAMTGLPSMLGWDWSTRLSMGNIIPGVAPTDGFNPGLLLGPAANVVSDMVNGATKLVAGDATGAQAFIPQGVRKIIRLANSGGDLKDYKGRPLPFQTTTGDIVGTALGFNPKKVADFNNASRIATQSEKQAKAVEDQFRQTQAEEVLKGNFGNVRQNLLQRAKDDNTYEPIPAAQSIARAAEELTFPRDLRREGTVGFSPQRQQLLSSLQIPLAQPSEVQRLNFRTQVEQRLGLRPQVGQDQVVAQLMDQLRARNPDSTRAELRRQAELFLRRQRISTLLPVSQEPVQ